MASSVSRPPNFDIAVITGPMCNTALLGCVTIQVYVYVLAFPHDKIVVKALGIFPGLNPKPALNISPVYSVFFLDLLQTGFATHYAWYVLAGAGVTRSHCFPRPGHWLQLLLLQLLWHSWSNYSIRGGSGSLAMVKRGSFPSSPSSYCSSIDIFNLQTATASCIAGWYTGIVLPNAGSGPLAQINFKRSIKTFDLDPAVTTWLAGAMACDIIITITLVVQLAIRRNEALVATKRIVHRTIRMAIETGAITSVAVTIELALILNVTTTSWYFMVGMLITKIYSNSLLASLNSRSPLFDGSTTVFWQPSNGPGNNTNVFSTSPPERSATDIGLGNTSLGVFEAKPGSFTGSRSEVEPV
ncbi:hypothetical protein DFH08DRAFT_1039294 [Mycena albidolilacea]|uniref:DUF6534 domain-containing protein n=1 Tax=Mycena albidolilacea TaxID=1033008 RepID=A0AAD7AJ66_9AGAR|nr:hypothetical protein DFH08DRAFT_1039294 [Mycena albidolilacea]